ncbi:hypothetical protein KR222_010332, partial [Zaprionus bogoriensis]
MQQAIQEPQQHQQQQQQQTQQQQQQQCEEQQKAAQNFDINLCDGDVDAAAAAAIRNISYAAGSSSGSRQQRGASAKAATTLRAVIIIMALVFSIMQQQQVRHWPLSNGLLAVAAAALHNNNSSSISLWQAEDLSGADVPALSSSLSSISSSSSSLLVASLAPPQADATNHTFKSLAFLGNTMDAFPPYASSSSSVMSDGFAVAPPATETELAQSLPIFDFGMPRNITGRTGHTEAIIKCRVDSLHDKSVSWIRKRDLHILTVGTATYTSDKRFQVTESKDSREWTLHVKSPLAKDSGIYECQVNTEPKMSMAFQLNIIEISPDAKAVISGPHDLHFKAGSAIILNCVVKQPSVKDIGPIYWYRGEHMITPFDADDDDDDDDDKVYKEQQQAGIMASRGQQKELAPTPPDQTLNEVLSTELQRDFASRIAMESQLGDTLKSRLRISNAQTTDTGNYTCQPTTASSASVMVHVINGES